MTLPRMLRSAIAVAMLMTSAAAQPSKPAFEVASIRKRVDTQPGPSMVVRGAPAPQSALFTRSGTSVASLVQFAFDLQLYQLAGGPDWIRTERFDISARSADVPTAPQLRLMVQSLLEDRFRLTAHREQRQMPIYSLVLAREDGRLGPGLRKSAAEDCMAPNTVPRPSNVPSGASTVTGCGSMSAFALGAARNVAAPVVDKTGLTGSWDYGYYFADDGSQLVALGLPRTPERLAVDPAAPAFGTALEEQLGLRLRATRGPVEVLVIDSVQQPTEN